MEGNTEFNGYLESVRRPKRRRRSGYIEAHAPFLPPRHRAWFFLFLCLTFAQILCAQEGQFNWQSASVEQLHEGILLANLQTTSPRALQIHCARIDTSIPGVAFYTTPRAREWVGNVCETIRRPTREFLRSMRLLGMNMILAINADAFAPWPSPWSQPLPADLRGLAVSQGTLVSRPNGTPSFIVHKDGTLDMAITDDSTDCSNMQTAVSGIGFCLQDGKPIESNNGKNPRTGYGLSQDHRLLYLLTVDGRRHASLGCTIAEVGASLKHFGAYTGINMDGGGSTTLVRYNPTDTRCELVNEPVGDGQSWHDKDPALEQQNFHTTERTNGNNMGVYIKTSPTHRRN